MKVTVDVDGQPVVLSHLDKVLYPNGGVIKGEVLDYYARIAPVLLPHLTGRALTRKRYPDGVDGTGFFEKNAPAHTPSWVRTHRVGAVDYVVVDSLASLMWTVNQGALELHAPLRRVGHDRPDLLVVDLDPGEGADLVACCEVAGLLRPLLESDGLVPVAKTSGRKGLQLYARADPFSSSAQTSAYVKTLGQHLERTRPDLVVHRMAKALRPGKVLVDWSQNHAAKTTVSVYSLRAQARPTVSTPVTWDEVARCRDPGDLTFTSAQVPARVAELGDLFAPLLAGPWTAGAPSDGDAPRVPT